MRIRKAAKPDTVLEPHTGDPGTALESFTVLRSDAVEGAYGAETPVAGIVGSADPGGHAAYLDDRWPAEEAAMVLDAIRTSPASGPDAGLLSPWSADSDGSMVGSHGSAEDPLAIAARRWALAHQSASTMRERLVALESLLPAHSGAERDLFHRAWLRVSTIATWTSLDQLEQAALTDPLTGTGNRRALDMALTSAMSSARRFGYGLVVIAIDLDGLKTINDSRGHHEGDRSLVSLVTALGVGLRTTDSVFRTGGDEFAVVLHGASVDDVPPLMERVAASGAPSFSWGAAARSDKHGTISELLEAADHDLYERRRVTRGSLLALAGTEDVRARHAHGAGIRPTRRTWAVAAAAVAAAGGLFAGGTALFDTALSSSPAHPIRPVTGQAPGTVGKSNSPIGNSPTGSTSPPVSGPSSSTTGSSVPPATGATSLAGISVSNQSSTTPPVSTHVVNVRSSVAPTSTGTTPSATGNQVRGGSSPTGTTPAVSPTPAVTSAPAPTGLSGVLSGLTNTVNGVVSTVSGLLASLLG